MPTVHALNSNGAKNKVKKINRGRPKKYPTVVIPKQKDSPPLDSPPNQIALPPEEAFKIISKRYNLQMTSIADLELTQNELDNIDIWFDKTTVPIPLKGFIQFSKPATTRLSKTISDLITPENQGVVAHAEVSSKRTDCTYIDAVIDKKRIRIIVNSGAIANIISSRLVQRLLFKPYIDFNDIHGTTGPSATRALGAYSSIPIRFGKLTLAFPAVVLESTSYDFLLGTEFLKHHSFQILNDTNILKVLEYEISMCFNKPLKEYSNKGLCLSKPINSKLVRYDNAKKNIPTAMITDSSFELECEDDIYRQNGILLYAPYEFTIPIHSQKNYSPKHWCYHFRQILLHNSLN